MQITMRKNSARRATTSNGWRAPLLAASLLCGTAAAALSEFGIEGMGVVSTPHAEGRASIAADGARIVWGSPDRPGGPGGGDLWQASLREGRWVDPQPLPINTASKETDPFLTSDGRWLYFASDRASGAGGSDLYRAPIGADGRIGAATSLGAGINSRGDERAPTASIDGMRLMFSSDGRGGAGRHDLFVATWDGAAFANASPVPGVDSAADETDGAWLGDGRALVYARSTDLARAPVQLLLAQCDGARYAASAPLALSFNTADGRTQGAMIDASKPGELLVTGSAKAPKAGNGDIYRMRAPPATGEMGCG